jgi:hypothetical protein
MSLTLCMYFLNKCFRWLHLYHAKFASDLKVLGHNPEKVYSFEAFRADYDELFYYGFTWAIQHTVVILLAKCF